MVIDKEKHLWFFRILKEHDCTPEEFFSEFPVGCSLQVRAESALRCIENYINPVLLLKVWDYTNRGRAY